MSDEGDPFGDRWIRTSAVYEGEIVAGAVLEPRSSVTIGCDASATLWLPEETGVKLFTLLTDGTLFHPQPGMRIVWARGVEKSTRQELVATDATPFRAVGAGYKITGAPRLSYLFDFATPEQIEQKRESDAAFAKRGPRGR